MSTSWRWASVFTVVALVDLLVRFGMPFRLTRVLMVEAVLFPAAALAFLLLMRQGPTQEGFRRKLQVILMGGLFLAGLRSGLWAAGIQVGTVNLLILVLAVLAWVVYRIRQRAAGRNGKDPHS